MKISIVTIVRNDSAHIGETLRSVLEQKGSGFEVEYIVIDGASTDGTAEIVAQYADKLAFFVSEKDSGIYNAMNKGISHCTGDIIGMINSGDRYLPGAFEIVAEAFRKEGLQGIYEYYQRIRHEENCVLSIKFEEGKMTSFMERCPSLSKVLDNDASPCEKYCDHCAGWSIPLYTKCGIYYVQNMVGRDKPQCISVRTPHREIAEKARAEFLASGVPADLVNSNLDSWEEVEKNKVKVEEK